jgi:hypothetical protein
MVNVAGSSKSEGKDEDGGKCGGGTFAHLLE